MFPSDFEAKTSHLTLAEDGAYNRLLRICWMTPGCTIPADEAWIMRRVRAHTEADKEAVRAILAEYFTDENGRYSNAKLSRIWREANEAHEKRKNAGSKGGKAKALKTNNSASSNAVAKPKQPEPEPEDKRDTNVSLALSAPEPASPLAEAVSAYNETASKAGWPAVQKMTPARSKALRARLKDCGGVGGWRDALARAAESDFLCGRTDKAWTGCGFDWLTKQANFTKLMEGNYDNRTGGKATTSNRPQNRPDPALEQIARLAGLSQASGDGGG
jgi:uncharacterized protein YdaU (DUF1376 family)